MYIQEYAICLHMQKSVLILRGASPTRYNGGNTIVMLPSEKTVLFEMNYPYQWHLEHMLDLTSALEPYSFIIEYIDVYDFDAFDEGGRETVKRLFKLENSILEPSPEMIPADKSWPIKNIYNVATLKGDLL